MNARLPPIPPVPPKSSRGIWLNLMARLPDWPTEYSVASLRVPPTYADLLNSGAMEPSDPALLGSNDDGVLACRVKNLVPRELFVPEVTFRLSLVGPSGAPWSPPEHPTTPVITQRNPTL